MSTLELGGGHVVSPGGTPELAAHLVERIGGTWTMWRDRGRARQWGCTALAIHEPVSALTEAMGDPTLPAEALKEAAQGWRRLVPVQPRSVPESWSTTTK